MSMTQRSQTFGTRSRIAVAGLLGVAVLAVTLTLVATELLFDSATAHEAVNQGDVQIAVFKQDDGALRVALQRRGPSGWESRMEPRLRIIRADAAPGVWYTSSRIDIDGASADRPLFCVIAHGGSEDRFWRRLRGFLHQSAHLSKATLRFETHLDGSAQAAAIDRCTEDGAAVIAATLAKPEHVSGPLTAARAAGARIVTFNSGPQHAEAVGSLIHLALNDVESGRVAGNRFNANNVTGPVVCVIHEEGNIGLEQRCDGFEESYQGASVLREYLPEGLTGDALTAFFKNRLTDTEQPKVEAVLALSADVLIAATLAADQVRDEVGIINTSSVGSHGDLVRVLSEEIRKRHVDILINDSVESQGFLLAGAMEFAHHCLLPAQFQGRPQLWLATPFVFQLGALRIDRATAIDTVRKLAQLEVTAAMDDQ